MTDTTLLPCPSCGTAPGQNGPWLNPDSWYVACQKCGLSTRDFDTDAEAIAAWNRRPSPSVHRQASAGQEGVTDVWDYEVMSVDGQWCHESRTGEAPDCEMFVIRNLRKRTPLDTPRLQQLFGDAIEGALAFGFQGNNPPPEGHWLWRFWNIGRAEATKAAALSTAAPESGWSPIETAPKDGTRVILEWDGKSINGFYLDNSQSSHPWQGWRVESLVVKPSGNPTRWQPFPAAGETQ